MPAEQLQGQRSRHREHARPAECVGQAGGQQEEERQVRDGLGVVGLAGLHPRDQGFARYEEDRAQPASPALQAQVPAQEEHADDGERRVARGEQRVRERRLQQQERQVRRVEDRGLDVRQEGSPQGDVRIPERKAPLGQGCRHVLARRQVQLLPVDALEEGRGRQVDEADQGGGGDGGEEQLTRRQVGLQRRHRGLRRAMLHHEGPAVSIQERVRAKRRRRGRPSARAAHRRRPAGSRTGRRTCRRAPPRRPRASDAPG